MAIRTTIRPGTPHSGALGAQKFTAALTSAGLTLASTFLIYASDTVSTYVDPATWTLVPGEPTNTRNVYVGLVVRAPLLGQLIAASQITMYITVTPVS